MNKKKNDLTNATGAFLYRNIIEIHHNSGMGPKISNGTILVDIENVSHNLRFKLVSSLIYHSLI